MFTTFLVFWPMTFPSGLSIGVCCLTGGPVDTRPTLFLAVLALICDMTMSAPGKSWACLRRFPWSQTVTTVLTGGPLMSGKLFSWLSLFTQVIWCWWSWQHLLNSLCDQLQNIWKITGSMMVWDDTTTYIYKLFQKCQHIILYTSLINGICFLSWVLLSFTLSVQ